MKKLEKEEKLYCKARELFVTSLKNCEVRWLDGAIVGETKSF